MEDRILEKGDEVWVHERYYASIPKSFDRVGTVVSASDTMVLVRLDSLKPRTGAEIIHLIPRTKLGQRVDRGQ